MKNKTMIELDFNCSVQYLCSLYKIHVPIVQYQPFPLNILTTYRLVKEQLTAFAPDLELVIIETDTQAASLATVEVYSTGTTLYYIPVRPLADLLVDPNRQQEAELLLYVFAYLYHVVDVPWFQHTGSFLDCTYEMLESWYTDVDEPEEEEFSLEMLSIFDRMRTEGDALQKKLQSFRGLQGWDKCLLESKPTNTKGQPLKKVAQAAWELYKAYPGRSFWDSIQPDLIETDEDDGERIRPDQYLSFFWDSEDEMYDNLMSSINTSLQEYGYMEEPVCLQVFDEPQPTVNHSLDFEQRLFTLIDDLCTLLNELV